MTGISLSPMFFRRLLIPLSALVFVPLMQSPSAEAETATPFDPSCEPAEADGSCPSEEEMAAAFQAGLENGDDCVVTASRQEQVEEDGECCYTYDASCDDPGGCRD